MRSIYVILFLVSIFSGFSTASAHEKKCGSTTCECVLKIGFSVGPVTIPCALGYEDRCYPQGENLPKACAKKYKGHEKDYLNNYQQCPMTCL